MRTFTTVTPDGRTHARRSRVRVYTHVVHGLTPGYVQWHANFATSRELAEREAQTQRGYGIKTRVVELAPASYDADEQAGEEFPLSVPVLECVMHGGQWGGSYCGPDCREMSEGYLLRDVEA